MSIPIDGLLRLLQIADSALPIGALSHSFGVESLASEGGLNVQELPHFFTEWLAGAGHTEAVCCVLGHRAMTAKDWQRLNAFASAMRPARESRDASLRLGRRFLKLAAALEPDPRLDFAGDAHLSVAFGLAGSVLDIGAAETAAAFLHQALFGAVSACQRLMPLGQSTAMRLLWDLKPQMARIVEKACANPDLDDVWALQPRLEIASMRHPLLHTRLFIS